MIYQPKFNYTEFSATTAGGVRHYVTPDGNRYPSITTVLGKTISQEKEKKLNDWRNSLGHSAADAYTKKAADHGSNVHLLAERYFKGEELFAPNEQGEPIPQKDIGAYNGLKTKLKNIDEVWGIEIPLYSDILQVAGRCDFIGKYKNKPHIIDFKTSTRIKTKKEIGDYALQMAFYAIAHNDLFNTDIRDGVIFMVAQEGFPMEFSFNLDDHLEELVERVERFHNNIRK